MENEISVLVGLAVVAGVIYFYKKNDKKSTPAPAPKKAPVAKKDPKRGPGSTPKKDTLAKKKPAVAKKTVAKKTAPKKTSSKKGSAKPRLQVK